MICFKKKLAPYSKHYYLIIINYYSTNSKNCIDKARKNKKNINVGKEKKPEKINIANNIHINYEFCHHCKQKKPIDIMMKCESHNIQQANLIKNFDKNFKSCNINGIITAKSIVTYNFQSLGILL